MKNFFTCLLSIVALNLCSQNERYEQFVKDSLEIIKVKLVRPQFKFDNRVTFVAGQALAINGIDAGVLLKDKLRFTLGYYAMKGSLKEFKYTLEGEDYGRLIELKYGSINTEFIYMDTRFFALGLPLEIAAGSNTFEDKNISTDQVLSRESGPLAFVNFGASGTFKPMRFLGLKAMVGYRKQVFNLVEDFNFDGFFTAIGLNVDVREIISDIKMYRLKKKYRRGNNVSN
ncbi:MAG: hypothetical protein K0S12_1574, partial [Bacteroidetes bacterium]|nr:hypothetical protein [Bacteroidota bacterium]